MKFTQHLIGYAPVKLLATLCAFGGIFIYTRLLTPEEYGRYSLMFSAMALLHMITLTWVEASAFRMARVKSRGHKDPNHFTTAVCLTLISLSLMYILLAGVWVLSADYPQYRAFIPFIAVLLPLNSLVKIAMESHRANQNVKRYMISASAKLLIGFSVGVLLAWKTGLGALAPFAGLATGALLLALYEGRMVIKEALMGFSNASEFKRWAAFGIPAAFAMGLDLLLSSADRFLIAFYLDEAAVGSYAAGYGIADKTVLFLVSWAALAAAPLLMEAYEESDSDLLQQRARDFICLILLAGLPVATGIALVADPLAEAMIGEGLRDSSKNIIPWIAFAGLLNGLVAFYIAESFNLAKKTRLKALLLLFPLGLNIALNIVLIPEYQLMGAVWATLISYAFAAALLSLFGRRYVSLPVPAKEILMITLACAAMYPVKFINTGLGPWIDLFAMAGVGAAIYGILVYSLNIAGSRKWLKTMWSDRNRAAA